MSYQRSKYQIEVRLAPISATMALKLSASEANQRVEAAVAESRSYYTLAVKCVSARGDAHIVSAGVRNVAGCIVMPMNSRFTFHL